RPDRHSGAAATRGSVHLRPHARLVSQRTPQRHSPREPAAGRVRIRGRQAERLGPSRRAAKRHAIGTTLAGQEAPGERASGRSEVAHVKRRPERSEGSALKRSPHFVRVAASRVYCTIYVYGTTALYCGEV